MANSPLRDQLADHLITPKNAAFVLIDYQPSQFATVRSMDTDLLRKNIVSTVKAAKAFGLPIVHSTVNVESGPSWTRSVARHPRPIAPGWNASCRPAGCHLPASYSVTGLAWRRSQRSLRSCSPTA